MMPDREKRPLVRRLLFGVAVPLFCFAVDPFFFSANSVLAQGFEGDWPLFGLGPQAAYAAYALLAAMILGMLLHCLVPAGPMRRAARPLLLVGVLFSAFFQFALLPILPAAAILSLLVLPLLAFAPTASLLVYFGALRESLTGAGAREQLAAWCVAAALIGLACVPLARYRTALGSLERAERPSALAPALERVAGYGWHAREELRRIYLASSPTKRLRMRNLYLEVTGRPLLELIADGR